MERRHFVLVPNITTAPKHPATYTNRLIPIFAELLKNCAVVLDPFAGVGKLALIKQHGFNGVIICNEIEKEWTNSECDVDEFNIGDAANMNWCESESISAICTSPTYGNRMADHFNARDGSKRITYRHYLGRELHKENTGRMQWGDKYCQKHKEVWTECYRVLQPGGLFILNVSDHIRQGQRVFVTDWHKNCLIELGFLFIHEMKVETPRMRFGENYNTRIDYESILIFKKDK